MMRSVLTAFSLPFLAALLLAQPTPQTKSPASLDELAQRIHAELEVHGERMLGKETYRWSTRLEKITNCRAQLSVRVANNFGDQTVRTETVNFSLGALEPFDIALQKSWLELPCADRQQCIFSTSTCTRTNKNAMVTDCTTASQKRVDSFALEFDGDVAAASRLERDFRQAIDLCRQPKLVTF
jgi:hypothetical protein